MKKKLIIVAIVALLVACASYSIIERFFSETTVRKNIDVEVYKAANYLSPAYANTTAALDVTVVRIKGNKRDTAWHHTFQPTELKEFPDSNAPIMQKISILNVNDNKERLEVYYKLTYDSKGSILNCWNTASIGKGQQKGRLHIQI